MLFWPQNFREYIEQRKVELMQRKDNLFKEMNDDIDGIFIQIENFRVTMEQILNEGLVPADYAREAKMFTLEKLKESEEESVTVSNSDEEDSEEKKKVVKKA